MSGLWDKILASYTPEKMKWDRRYPWIGFVLRPISFPLTYLACSLGLSANAVTHITVVTAVIACGFLAAGNIVFGGIFLIATNLIDCVDGNIARLRGPRPPGWFLDAVASHPYYWCYFFMGVGLIRENPAATLPLAAGAWTSIARFSTWLCSANYQAFRGKLAGQVSQPAGSGVTASPLYLISRNFFDLIAHDFLVPALPLIVGGPELFLYASAAIATAETAAVHLYFYGKASLWKGPAD